MPHFTSSILKSSPKLPPWSSAPPRSQISRLICMAPYPTVGLLCPQNSRTLLTKEPLMSPLFREPINFQIQASSSNHPHRLTSPSPSLRKAQPLPPPKPRRYCCWEQE